MTTTTTTTTTSRLDSHPPPVAVRTDATPPPSYHHHSPRPPTPRAPRRTLSRASSPTPPLTPRRTPAPARHRSRARGVRVRVRVHHTARPPRSVTSPRAHRGRSLDACTGRARRCGSAPPIARAHRIGRSSSCARHAWDIRTSFASRSVKKGIFSVNVRARKIYYTAAEESPTKLSSR